MKVRDFYDNNVLTNMVNRLHLYSAFKGFNHSKCFYNTYTHSSIHIHTFIQWLKKLPCKVPTCSSGSYLIHIHTYTHTMLGQPSGAILPKDFDMWTGGAQHRTTDLRGWLSRRLKPQMIWFVFWRFIFIDYLVCTDDWHNLIYGN